MDYKKVLDRTESVTVQEVARAMEVYGGSFMSSIGKALYHADSFNVAKIKSTWPNEWEQYTEFALIMRNKNS